MLIYRQTHTQSHSAFNECQGWTFFLQKTKIKRKRSQLSNTVYTSYQRRMVSLTTSQTHIITKSKQSSHILSIPGSVSLKVASSDYLFSNSGMLRIALFFHSVDAVSTFNSTIASGMCTVAGCTDSNISQFFIIWTWDLKAPGGSVLEWRLCSHSPLPNMESKRRGACPQLYQSLYGAYFIALNGDFLLCRSIDGTINSTLSYPMNFFNW